MSSLQLPSQRFAPASIDASHQIALEIRRYLEREGLQPGDRIGPSRSSRRSSASPADAPRGPAPAASSHLIRVGRGRAGGISSPHAQRGHERHRHRVDLDDAATETVSPAQPLDVRMFLEVPLAGLAAANAAEATARGQQAAIDDASEYEPGYAAVQRGRQAL